MHYDAGKILLLQSNAAGSPDVMHSSETLKTLCEISLVDAPHISSLRASYCTM